MRAGIVGWSIHWIVRPLIVGLVVRALYGIAANLLGSDPGQWIMTQLIAAHSAQWTEAGRWLIVVGITIPLVIWLEYLRRPKLASAVPVVKLNTRPPDSIELKEEEPGVVLTFESNLSMFPPVVPKGGWHFLDLAIVELNSGPALALPLGSSMALPGAPVGWPAPDRDLSPPHKCEVVNRSAKAIFNVMIPAKVEFREVTTSNGSTSSGKAIAVRDVPILITKIEPGIENAFTFYVFSQSHNFAFVTISEKAYYVPLNGNTSSEATVKLLGFIGLSFAPMRLKGAA